MHILMIGGTSFFGAEIVRLLLEADHQVTVFTRGRSRPAWFDQVEHIPGDRFQPAEFQSRLRDRTFDVVIDNIAFKAEDARVALNTFAGRIGRYILTSTGSVYLFNPEPTVPLEEDAVDFSWRPPDFDPEHFVWQYAAGKLAVEQVVMNQDRIPWTIIRPPMVLGPNDSTLRGYFYFQRLLDGRPLILTNGGVQSFRLVYSVDLARGYVLALEQPAAIGQAFNIAQTEIITLRDFVETAARTLGVQPDLVNIPQEVIQQSNLEYVDPYASMVNFIMGVDRARQVLGYQSTPYRQWVGDTALWYRDTYQGPDSPGYEQRDAEVQFAAWFQHQTRLTE